MATRHSNGIVAVGYARRSTDHGSIPRRPSTLDTLRRVLGLVPVTESLRSLSHWRRRPAR